MKSTLILFLFLLMSINGFAQSKPSGIVFATTDIPNRFFMGDDSVVHYIKQNYRVCEGISGNQTVVMSLVVEPDGSTTEVEIISKITPVLKERILSMFETFPKWKPGLIKNKPVRSGRMLLFKCANGEVILPPYKTPEY